MRFEKVIAHAFGPFSDRTLEFAPGMNVVYGVNEAGKSSWHAALYAGLCGLRRGRGGLRREDEVFAERHRPWDGDEWRVGAIIALEDGRRVELHHDLDARVDCGATDADRGLDYSAEIMHDGAPDGSLWLGLDRRSFLAVACVRQADVLSVRGEAGLLQEYLQRAAASSTADATAAQALEQLNRFRSDHVGSDRANARGPLRAAMNRVERAKQALERAQADHWKYTELAAMAEDRKQSALEEEQALRLLRARLAIREAETWEKRVELIRALARQFPQGPPPPMVDDDELAQAVAAVLRAWEERPESPSLSGSWSLELRAEIESLPEMPQGDTQLHPAVVAARDTLLGAIQALQIHDEGRPPEPKAPYTGGLFQEELRDLARELATSLPELDPVAIKRFEKAKQRVEALSRRSLRGVLLGVAAVLALAGAALLMLGLVVSGLTLLFGGGAIAVWGLATAGHADRLAAERELREAEKALGHTTYARDEVEQRLEAAGMRVDSLGLPSEPDQLRALADELSAAVQARLELDRWQQRRAQLEERRRQAEQDLAMALRARKVAVDGDVAGALRAYEEGCRRRAGQAAQAKRRASLEAQLEARVAAERVADAAERRRKQAQEDLRRLATQCDVAGENDEDIAVRLHEWQERRREKLEQHAAATKEWARLEGLLQGQTVAEAEVEAERRLEVAQWLAAGLDADDLSGVSLENDPERQVHELEQAAREAARLRDEARGQVEESARNLLNVAEAEEEMALAETELARVRKLDQALQLTRDFLERAQDRVQRDIAPVLRETVLWWLRAVTANRYQDARVDPETLNVQLCDQRGKWRDAALLSHGTAEQTYLLLRVALAQHLTKHDEISPLVLDDVTVQSDKQRTEAILRTLYALSQERQVILFTQEDDVLAWAEAHLHPPRDRIERLSLAPVAT